jgi:GH25 family lysozyme M1 (1,4-beta-N-acetylmuramidase)
MSGGEPMPTPSVIDISHHQTIPASLVPAKQAGIVGCIHKASEGTSYVDDKLDARFYLARDAEMKFGVYHFMRPGAMAAQVEHFHDTIAHLLDDDPDLLIAADYEVDDISIDELLEFIAGIEQQCERSCVLYSGHTLKEALATEPNWELSQRRLWLAQYSSTPTLPAGWDKYWLWQYSQDGNVPGINPPVDLNQYGGDSIAQLLAEWSGTDRAPLPPVPDDRPRRTIEITVRAPPRMRILVNGQEIAAQA